MLLRLSFSFFSPKNLNYWDIKFNVSLSCLLLFHDTDRAKIYAVIGPVSDIASAINSIPAAILLVDIDE